MVIIYLFACLFSVRFCFVLNIINCATHIVQLIYNANMIMKICSEKHPNESILQFNDLMHLLDVYEKLNVFLLMGSANKRIVSNISRYFENNPERFKRVVVCSRSPIAIYQVINSLFILFFKLLMVL